MYNAAKFSLKVLVVNVVLHAMPNFSFVTPTGYNGYNFCGIKKFFYLGFGIFTVCNDNRRTFNVDHNNNSSSRNIRRLRGNGLRQLLNNSSTRNIRRLRGNGLRQLRGNRLCSR